MSNENKLVSEAQIKQADWKNKRDIDLANEWGVSRERVRQLRNQHNAPACENKHISSKTIKLREWLQEFSKTQPTPPEPWPYTPAQLFKLIPKSIKIGQYTALKSFENLLLSEAPVSGTGLVLKHVNWNLPNQFIEAAWGLRYNWAANYRSRLERCTPMWTMGGRAGKQEMSPEDLVALTQAVNEECQTAEKLGFVPKKRDLQKLFKKISK